MKKVLLINSLWKAALLMALGSAPVFAWASPQAGVPQTDLPRRVLSAEGYAASVQVAATPESRRTGLMYRLSLPENEGMLLVFGEEGRQCLWMRNTPLPLSAAFVRGDGTVAGVAEMAPLGSELHCSDTAVRYAWEMPQGWFARRGIGAGSRVDNLPF